MVSYMVVLPLIRAEVLKSNFADDSHFAGRSAFQWLPQCILYAGCFSAGGKLETRSSLPPPGWRTCRVCRAVN